jgi:hypothetical protein
MRHIPVKFAPQLLAEAERNLLSVASDVLKHAENNAAFLKKSYR